MTNKLVNKLTNSNTLQKTHEKYKMCREKFNLKYNFCYYYFSVMKDMTSESPTLFIYIFKRKTSRLALISNKLSKNGISISIK